MFIETFKYEDFNEEQREEVCCFHLSESKITDMNLSQEGGLMEYIKRIVQTRSSKELADLFKSLIIRSYGVKSLDGRRFIQTPEVVTEFMQTPMYDQLYMRLATDTDYAIKFLIGILPKSMQKELNADKLKLEVSKQLANGTVSVSEIPDITNDNKS